MYDDLKRILPSIPKQARHFLVQQLAYGLSVLASLYIRMNGSEFRTLDAFHQKLHGQQYAAS